MNENYIDIYICGDFHKRELELAVDDLIGLYPEVQNWVIERRPVGLVAFVWHIGTEKVSEDKVNEVNNTFSHSITAYIRALDKVRLSNFVIVSHSLNAGTCAYGPFFSTREADKWGSLFFNDWGNGHSWSVEQLIS